MPVDKDDDDLEEDDPQFELIKQLLEYKKYKSVVATLAEMEAERLKKEKRGNLKKEIKKLAETINVESEMQDLDLYKMMKVFQKVMKRYEFEQNKPVHQVVQYPYTIEKQKTKLMERLMSGINFANRSASAKGSSITLAVSRMDDLAAMVP